MTKSSHSIPWWSNDPPDLLEQPGQPARDLREASTPIVDPGVAIARLSNAPDAIQKKAKRANQLLKKAEAATTERELVKRFHEASKAFNSVLREISKIDPGDWDATQALYWMRMERAYCLLAIGDEETIRESAAIYKDVQAEYPDDAVSRLRYGQILRRWNDYEGAIKQVQQAISILDKGSDDLIGDDHWVHSAVRRGLGFAYWRQNETLPTTEAGTQERVRNLRKAIRFTEDALKKSPDKVERGRCLNNLVYYAWEERELLPASTKFKISDAAYKRYVEEYREAAEVKRPTQHNFLDTLCRALLQLGELGDARNVAVRVIQMLNAKMGEKMSGGSKGKVDVKRYFSAPDMRRYLNSDEIDEYLFAIGVVSKKDLQIDYP